MSKRTLQVGVAQLIAPFGPGAIVDILGESFVTLTADRWPKKSLLPEIECPRLSDRLGVQRFYGPPPAENPDDPRAISVTVSRFPAWLFCQTCRRMVHWTAKDENGAAPACPHDSGRLVPMRFVVACRERSHAADVPWVNWVHRAAGESGTCKEKAHLRFQQIQGGSQGLSGLEVSCGVCGTRRTLGELRSDVLSREGMTCRGVQPWESEWGQCGKPLEILQRGSTNFHYGESEAAIDIPAMTATALNATDRISQHPLFLGLKETIEGPNAPLLAQMIASELFETAETVLAAARAANGDGPDIATTHAAIISEEFQAFRAAALDQADEANFKTRSVTLHRDSADRVERALADLCDNVILVDRLREVRVSLGFKRYSPDADSVRSVARASEDASWLPAAEGFGEGIFLRLNGDRVDTWASLPAVAQRLSEISSNYDASRFANRLHRFSPQYVALHSLAHSLLREFSFTSGYSAASLRERVYCDPGANEYGVFIYTTSSDEEGTLGGLVREGEHDRVGTALARAAEQLSWCSNDPVCAESTPQNLDGLNLAACHSCLLASETSCEGSNLLLDRVLLAGDESVPGLLAGVISAVAGGMQ